MRRLFLGTFLLMLNSLLLQELLCASYIKQCDALALVNPFRFDIMAKYIYARARELNVQSDWPLEVYREHIHVWGNYIEVGKFKPEKVGFAEYLNAFHAILDSIKNDQFNWEKSAIPVGKKSIKNGAHRLAACLLYNKKVFFQSVKHDGIRATADYFKNRTKYVVGGLAEKYLDAMALQYCELKKKTVCILMVIHKHGDQDTKKQISLPVDSLVYHKQILLMKTGILNIFKLLKMTPSMQCKEISLLANEPKKVDVFLFDLKESLRHQLDFLIRKYNDNDITYLSTNETQALMLCQTFFNQNSVNFINSNTIDVYKKLDQKLIKFKKLLMKYKIPKDECCLYIDLINVNKIHYLDVIFHDKNAFNVLFKKHNNFVRRYDSNNDNILKDNLIFNPQYFFYYRNIKIALLGNLLEGKEKGL